MAHCLLQQLAAQVSVFSWFEGLSSEGTQAEQAGWLAPYTHRLGWRTYPGKEG